MIDTPDLVRLTTMLARIDELDTTGALAAFGMEETAEELAGLATLHHIGLVVFPDWESEVVEFLKLCGLAVAEPVPSTVVAARLAERYGQPPANLPVSIVIGGLGNHADRAVEVFVLPGLQNRADGDGIAARERRGGFETHVAFEVRPECLDVARKLVCHRTGLVADGGGHNPFEQAGDGGRSVFYFAAQDGTGNRREHGFHRLELFCAGHHEKALREHAAAAVTAEPEIRLLELVTGHVTTKALSVTAELGLADALATGPLTGEQAAGAVGGDPSSVTRLLRYLAGLGVVTVVGDHYVSTPVLELLRRDNAFADLAIVYGGEFLTAWEQLGHAVRTGRSAFGHVFGQEHFEYFADNPELSERFNRTMTASTRALVARLGGAYDFSSARRVVDVGGGDGTLLHAILDRAPAATGILFDRKHVITGESVTATDRVELVEGDFFDAVPAGGDLYVLSRILHDWDDDRCERLLACCRAAMAPGTTLLAIERVLPDEPVPSPALTWDLQMLAITGGRERTHAEYTRLLAGNGFVLENVTPVWHGMSLLAARAL
ncbi:methyltransferase [Actinophytocola oryzae]|uniref:O-methyltransferase n=1 Tax=Actinophytocola oryzae TaxID=502181 RepID=A0A4R7VHT8_9PSEU|nr:methyltransferase [Actinophytocola oryzae]TDV48648.1 O-methyltransferase [Actinophytocola oryzae]